MNNNYDDGDNADKARDELYQAMGKNKQTGSRFTGDNVPDILKDTSSQPQNTSQEPEDDFSDIFADADTIESEGNETEEVQTAPESKLSRPTKPTQAQLAQEAEIDAGLALADDSLADLPDFPEDTPKADDECLGIDLGQDVNTSSIELESDDNQPKPNFNLDLSEEAETEIALETASSEESFAENAEEVSQEVEADLDMIENDDYSSLFDETDIEVLDESMGEDLNFDQ